MTGFWGRSLLLFFAFSTACLPAYASLTQEIPWNQSRSYLAEGKAEEARQALEKLLDKYPKEPDLYLALAVVSLRLKQTGEAERFIRRALSLDSSHVEARTLLGWIELELHQNYPAAIEEYSQVVRLKHDSPEAHNNLGVALKKKGELGKAAASFNRALEHRPDYAEALNNRGWLYIEQKKWSLARSDFEQVLRGSPQHEGALYGLARSLREMRDYAGAQNVLSRLTLQSPNLIYWLERGELQLIRYYWVLLLIAGAIFARSQYKKAKGQGRTSNGS